MNQNFPVCLADTLQFEGGYVDNPHDPGGATNRGITQSTYDAWRRLNKETVQSVELISDAECEAIYQQQYWLPARCDVLPSGLDLCQFDSAVNTGPVEATRLLQQALGVDQDGIFGVETLDAVQRCQSVPALIQKVCAARLSFYRRLKTWIYFGKGWTSRDTGIDRQALAMYASESSKVEA
jgi:lysozyme family protein